MAQHGRPKGGGVPDLPKYGNNGAGATGGLHPHELPGGYGDRQKMSREGIKRSYSSGDKTDPYVPTKVVEPGQVIDHQGRIVKFDHNDKLDPHAKDMRFFSDNPNHPNNPNRPGAKERPQRQPVG